jgi:predicted enzyme related to lactoylglutathione lyase
MAPTRAHGKTCYLEMPAVDIERSAAFYETVFGWHVRRRGDGATAFDDTTGAAAPRLPAWSGGARRAGRPESGPGSIRRRAAPAGTGAR